MELVCCGKQMQIRMEKGGKISILILGQSRMGKTVCALGLAEFLVGQGYSVQLIDFGMRWSPRDVRGLLAAGVTRKNVDADGIVLTFASASEVVGCSRIILDAIGISSHAAESLLRDEFSQLCENSDGRFSWEDIMETLKGEEVAGNEQKWSEVLLARLSSLQGVPQIQFQVDARADFSEASTIWDLWGIEEAYVQTVTYLILYALYCQQRRKLRDDRGAKGVFAVLDEFQNLDCSRRSILGTCLVEGQKYGLGLILITQFLQGNFSEAVVNQFKQGGFRFYFRLTEEDAWAISRQLVYDSEQKKRLCEKLIRLPRGRCLFVGPHSLEGRQKISEAPRFVEIKADISGTEPETTDINVFRTKESKRGRVILR